MSNLCLSDVKINNGKRGRRKKVTKEILLETIRQYKTDSPSELAKILEVSRMTVYRKLQEIPREEIDKIFEELAEYELKPAEMVWEVFKQLPEMKEYDMMLKRQQISKEYKYRLLRGIYHICKYLKKRPRSLTVEMLDTLADLVLKIKNREINQVGLRNEALVRNAIRSWYIYHGVSGQLLTAKGITGEHGQGYGKRALDRLTKEQRRKFLEALRQVIIEEGLEEELAIWESLPYWLFYTGTRIKASLNIKIEDIRWNGNLNNPNTIGRILVIDKGRHRRGRTKWIKLIAGELKEKILENLKSRGNPQQGYLFPFSDFKVREIFRKAYKKAGIEVHQPAHIWRHTGAQELLDATDWNYELVASILGWKDTKTLKECYGKMGESIRVRALRKALGMPVEEKPKLFKF